jgi:hypothetical protein
MCGDVLPIAKSLIGKTIAAGITGTIGLAKTKTLGGTLVAAVIGILIGHAVDGVIDDFARPICNRCRSLQEA